MTDAMTSVDVSIITCTGFRPEALELCCDYVRRFDLASVTAEWIVVDDELQLDQNWTDHEHPNIVRAIGLAGVAHGHQVKFCTLPKNFQKALMVASGRLIVVVEDDDWYARDYVLHLWDLYEQRGYRLLGFAPAVYYNVATRQFQGRYSQMYSSLCRTAFSRSLVTRAHQIAGDCYRTSSISIDVNLWGASGLPSDERHLSDAAMKCVSIKGMPGRGGAGRMHKAKLANEDKDMETLIRWIGKEDAERYRRFGE